jgi:hypothetical protein
MVLLLSLLPSFGKEDDTRSMNANSSPTTLMHAVCQAL